MKAIIENMRYIGTFFAIGFFIFSFCGCAVLVGAAAGGAGAAFWLSGKLSEQVNATYEEAIKAVESGLSSIGLEVIKEIRTEKTAQIKSKYTDGSTVWIDVKPLTKSIVKVDVRVGVKGDKAASSRIMEAIKKQL